MNGLNRRVGALEARIATDPLADFDLAGHGSFERLAERIATLARRYAEAEAPPLELQSPAERIVRRALGAAGGRVGDDYARAFWRTISAGLRAYEDGRAA